MYVPEAEITALGYFEIRHFKTPNIFEEQNRGDYIEAIILK